MHARFLDVLHHARDDHPLAVAHRIDIDLERVFEIVIDQHRPIGRGFRRNGQKCGER